MVAVAVRVCLVVVVVVVVVMVVGGGGGGGLARGALVVVVVAAVVPLTPALGAKGTTAETIIIAPVLRSLCAKWTTEQE